MHRCRTIGPARSINRNRQGVIGLIHKIRRIAELEIPMAVVVENLDVGRSARASDIRASGRMTQTHVERLGTLARGIIQNGDIETLQILPICESKRPTRRGVIGTGQGGAIGCGVVHRDSPDSPARACDNHSGKSGGLIDLKTVGLTELEEAGLVAERIQHFLRLHGDVIERELRAVLPLLELRQLSEIKSQMRPVF